MPAILRQPGVVALCLLAGGWAMAGVATRPAPETRVVYRNDFAKAAGPEWSAQDVTPTPKGGNRILGPFAKAKVSLSLAKLPAHRYLRVSFDLVLIGSWDGNHAQWGPDTWRLDVAGGPTLLATTFCYDDGEARQAFPDQQGGAAHPPETGAATTDTTGFRFRNDPVDAVYKLSFVFPHTADAVRFDFAATGNIVNLQDESWGLDDVKVEALAGPAPVGAAALRRLWEQLGGGDPVAAHRAKWALIAAGAPGRRFLREQLDRDPAAADSKKVARLIAQLDHDDWRTREAATEALIRMGPPVRAAVGAAAGPGASLEVRTRSERILKAMTPSASATPREMRRRRAAHALAVLSWLPAKGATAPAER